jgi:Concanavalin A-like lectin/glucanases superfamily
VTHERAFVRHVACRLAVVALIGLSIVGVFSWQSAGYDRAAAEVQPSASSGNGLPQPIGFWRLGQGPKGAVAASVADSSPGNHPLAGQNVTRCQNGPCATFNGSNAAFTTSGPIVTTGPGSSFTVSAEVELDKLPTNGLSSTAVAQDGGSNGDSAFYLQWYGGKGCWAFARETTRSYGCTGNYTGTWTRLTGVYDGSSGQTLLYVNGKLAETTTDTAPAASNGPVTIGRAMFQGNQVDWWDGSIRNVEIFGQALTPAQVHGIAALAASPVPAGAPAIQSSPTPSATGSRQSASSTVLWIAVGVAVIVAAAIVAFVLYRRRKKPAVRNASPTPADRSAAWAIDRALKALTTACDDEGIAFPGVYLVTVDAASITVTVSKPSAKAPAGWTASSDGRTWSARLSALQTSNVRDTARAPFAGLVMLGTSEYGRVLLDLDQAGGPISVDGPKASVDETVEAWVTELTTNPWSTTVRVARVHARNEPNLESAENLLADLDVGERALIVFEEPPSRSQTAALRAHLTSAAAAWILIKGAAPVATWRLTANRGVLSSGFLPDIRYSASPDAPRRSPISPAGN